MSAPETACVHAKLAYLVNVRRMEDIGAFIADLIVWCGDCGEKFRFRGLDAGASPYRPMVSPDALTCHLPIEPEGPHGKIATRFFIEAPVVDGRPQVPQSPPAGGVH